jgi:hypothetical protein
MIKVVVKVDALASAVGKLQMLSLLVARNRWRHRNVSTTLRHPFGEFSVACVLKNTPIMSGSRYAPRCGGCAPRLPGLSPFPGIFKPYLTFPENYLEEG